MLWRKCKCLLYKLSDFGTRLSGEAGILQLMDDLGDALASGAPHAMFDGSM